MSPLDDGDDFEAKICLEYFLSEKPGLTSQQKQVLVIDYEERRRDFGGDIAKPYKDARCNPLLMRYGYAMTAHKAQGSEADDVYVIASKNTIFNPWSSFLRRAVYTACSRARKNLYLVDQSNQ